MDTTHIMKIARSVRSSVPFIAALLPAVAMAAAEDSGWHGRAMVYAWLPSVDGETIFTDPDAPDEDVDVGKILQAIDTVFMGGITVRNGSWGLLSDYIYLDLSDDKDNALSLGFPRPGASIELGYSAKLRLTGYVWNTAGTYRLVDKPGYHLELLGGFRYLDLEEEFQVRFFAGDDSSSDNINVKAKDGYLDGIIGVHGKAVIADSRWYTSYYLDVGTGDSDITWQAIAGIGYAFDSLDLSLSYRHLEWDFGPNRGLQSLSFSGAMFGIGFRW